MHITLNTPISMWINNVAVHECMHVASAWWYIPVVVLYVYSCLRSDLNRDNYKKMQIDMDSYMLMILHHILYANLMSVVNQNSYLQQWQLEDEDYSDSIILLGVSFASGKSVGSPICVCPIQTLNFLLKYTPLGECCPKCADSNMCCSLWITLTNVVLYNRY